MTSRGLWLTLGVLALFLAIFLPLALRISNGRDRTIDGERLRRTFAALVLYETEHDGRPAPNLGLIRRDVEPSDLQSVADPEATNASNQGKYPLDPALPNLKLRTPARVSWSYRWHWREAGKIAPSQDPRQVLLVDWWPGALLRVNMDGSLVEKPQPGSLTFTELFGK